MKIDYQWFLNMEPMKYYSPATLEKPKAQDMLANKDCGYTAMEKRDGEWCMAIIDDCGNVYLRSRSKGVSGEYGNKTAYCPHICGEISRLFPKETVLLGELCFKDKTTTAKDVGTILRCKPEKAVQRQNEDKNKLLHFNIFDCLAWNGEEIWLKSFKERFVDRHQILEDACNCAATITVAQIYNENFLGLYEKIISEGGEGIVIMENKSSYAHGRRPAWSSLKVKKAIDEVEVLVIDTIAPKKHYDGDCPETWQYKVDGELVTKPYYFGWKNGIVILYKGIKTEITSGLTDEYRAWLAAEESLKLIKDQKVYAKVAAMEILPSGVFRHAILKELIVKK